MVTLPDDVPMNQTPDVGHNLAPGNVAVQHGAAKPHSPRPLPLFLELVRRVAERDPERAKKALAGLERYAAAPRSNLHNERPVAATVNGAALRDFGGQGRPVVLVPSLINPPHILDLDEEVSLARALTASRRVLLVDWGDARERADLDIGGHIERLLLPLIATVDEPPALVGYCLGGTMAMAAAQLTPVERVATLAAPWHFDGYDEAARRSLTAIWDSARTASGTLGALPMEVLQAAFWALDPERTVAKFAAFGALDPGSDEARRFVSLEDWANEGEPLPLPAARELFVDLFGSNRSGGGTWTIAGNTIPEMPSCPTLHCLAANDHIVPAATAATGQRVIIPSGHVGMIVGGKRAMLHQSLGDFL
jgi:polyhydroxyalkanoate synthase